MTRTAPFLVALVLAAAVGCTGELIPVEPGPGIGGGGAGPDADVGGGGGGGGGGDVTARQYFDDTVQPLLALARPRGSCAACHQGQSPGDGPDFLGVTAADNYDALLADTRIVGATPGASLLVIKGAHSGDAFAPSELSTINQWIIMESEQ